MRCRESIAFFGYKNFLFDQGLTWNRFLGYMQSFLYTEIYITIHTTPGKKKARQQDYITPVTVMALFSDASSLCQVCSAGYRAHVASGVTLSQGCSPKSTNQAGPWCCWLCSRSKAVTSTFKQCIEHPLNIQVRNKKAT